MAQSRPPPVRVHTTTSASPPPLSPRAPNGEKRHHSRRKSGRTEYVVSEKKSSRPATQSRKSNTQYVTKVSTSTSRTHHRERDDEDRGRDSGETFPQFCMNCEKQFLPADNTFLYCSESCRLHDTQPSQPLRTNSYPTSYSPPLTPFSHNFEDGPDIVPRFSPTQSRPRSYFASEPYPASYQQESTLSSSTPYHSTYHTEHTSRTNSSALESLRELATALPPTNRRKGSREHRDEENHSPPKSAASSITRNGSAVWDYIPFTSGSKSNTPAATPGNSYTAPYTVAQAPSYSVQPNSTYSVYGYGYAASGGGGSREDLYAYANSHTASAGFHGSTGGMDRPLPPRSGPGGYGHRPKSIDLVTPFGGH